MDTGKATIQRDARDWLAVGTLLLVLTALLLADAPWGLVAVVAVAGIAAVWNLRRRTLERLGFVSRPTLRTDGTRSRLYVMSTGDVVAQRALDAVGAGRGRR